MEGTYNRREFLRLAAVGLLASGKNKSSSSPIGKNLYEELSEVQLHNKTEGVKIITEWTSKNSLAYRVASRETSFTKELDELIELLDQQKLNSRWSVEKIKELENCVGSSTKLNIRYNLIPGALIGGGAGIGVGCLTGNYLTNMYYKKGLKPPKTRRQMMMPYVRVGGLTLASGGALGGILKTDSNRKEYKRRAEYLDNRFAEVTVSPGSFRI